MLLMQDIQVADPHPKLKILKQNVQDRCNFTQDGRAQYARSHATFKAGLCATQSRALVSNGNQCRTQYHDVDMVVVDCQSQDETSVFVLWDQCPCRRLLY